MNIGLHMPLFLGAYEDPLYLLAIICLALVVIIIALLALLRNTKHKTVEGQAMLEQLQGRIAELQASQETAQDFVADVSHEFQSVLTILYNFAQLLQQPDLSTQQRADYATIISDEVHQLSALCKQLLLLARLDYNEGTVEKQSYCLNEQLRKTLQLFQYQLSNKGIIATVVMKEQSLIWGDKVLLQQVWSNLLSNAIKHTAEEGSIAIEVTVDHSNCIVTITDSGEGIAQPAELLFQRFAYDKSKEQPNSHGLGLSIVKKIISLHNGQIHIASTEGEGTRVVVSIPQQY